MVHSSGLSGGWSCSWIGWFSISCFGAETLPHAILGIRPSSKCLSHGRFTVSSSPLCGWAGYRIPSAIGSCQLVHEVCLGSRPDWSGWSQSHGTDLTHGTTSEHNLAHHPSTTISLHPASIRAQGHLQQVSWQCQPGGMEASLSRVCAYLLSRLVVTLRSSVTTRGCPSDTLDPTIVL